MSEALALEASGLTKRFGALLALDAVSLQLRPGTVHALLGENGAGKSTLVKCIMGYYQADEGAVRIGGADTAIKSPRDAAALGIGMVYQHFTLVDNMTVAENLVLARRALPFVFDWKAEHQNVAAFMERMPFSLDPGRPVRTLAAGEKQKLEILKQLYLGSSIVILDEPTSVLTPDEADEVLGYLQKMVRGSIARAELGSAERSPSRGRSRTLPGSSILMISHKFREVMKFADEVTILRRGRWVGGGKVADLTPEAMARMMVGEDPPRANQQRHQRAHGGVVLDIRGLRAVDDLGTPAVVDLDLRVHAGEIVGVAGVSGNGQEELVEVLAGQRIARAGTVVVNGKDYRARRDEMRTQRVRCLPDEPLRNACVGAMSVAENIGFRLFDRAPFARGRMLVSQRALRKNARALIADYGIRAPGPDAPIASLSGGNVQRAVLARELRDDVSLLVASNPCFGLDFAAVAEIRSRLVDARNRGAAVLLISADLDEIFALADRIVVMSEGRAVHEVPIGDADLGIIGRHMAGHE